jgi:hypothetical protein
MRKHGRHSEGFHDWIQEQTPPALIVLTCTALHHVLMEWQRNGGLAPTKVESDDFEIRRKRPEWEYYFNRNNDGGKCGFHNIWNFSNILQRLTLISSIFGTISRLH